MSKKGAQPWPSSYPRQSMIQPQRVAGVQFPQPPPYTEPPPSYAELQQPPRYVQVPPRMSANYPGELYVEGNPSGPATPQMYYVVPQIAPPQSTVLVEGAYDGGARFGTGASANIPPPPPGSLPNAAQIAAMQGRNVVLTKKKDSWVTGGSDGGYAIW